MLLIKNDPNYNEQWPRALVPYKRIYGIDEPKRLPAAGQRRQAVAAPAGGNAVRPGRHVEPVQARELSQRRRAAGQRDRDLSPAATIATATAASTRSTPAETARRSTGSTRAPTPASTPTTTSTPSASWPWSRRPTATRPKSRPAASTATPTNGCASSARSRCASFEPGEASESGGQPLDPDGNPDTSFLAKIPADVAFTFQTLDKDGMVLNMAQTWHQLRPGEIRNDCGGCHAHSQKPTAVQGHRRRQARLPGLRPDREDAAADRQGERPVRQEVGQRRPRPACVSSKGVKNVEYYRDVKPILDRSCVACHTRKSAKPAGNLVLDDDKPINMPDYGRPGARHLLPPGRRPDDSGPRSATSRSSTAAMAADQRLALRPHVPVAPQPAGLEDLRPAHSTAGPTTISRTETRSRRPEHAAAQGQAGAEHAGEPQSRSHLIYTGSIMPPPEAVAGTYVGPDGKKIKVAPLTDEDRRTLVRWIDLGCPIDLDYDPAKPQATRLRLDAATTSGRP